MPCIEHHNLPCTLSNLVTGLVTVPIDKQCDEVVFQAMPSRKYTQISPLAKATNTRLSRYLKLNKEVESKMFQIHIIFISISKLVRKDKDPN